MKELLHFSHGNGFPSPCYRQLLQSLQGKFDCHYIDRIGHSLNFPVSENWHSLVEEVIASVRANATEPVIALGHSLGGVLSFLAAVEQPDLFKAVILLDAPIIGRVKSNILRLSKAMGMIDHVTPAFLTRGRRQYWESRNEALSYLKSRNLFKTFTDTCIEDYIDYGMEKNENGYSLRFNRQIEYQIYRTIPHILHEYKGTLKTPTALIYGSNSNIIDWTDLRYMKKHHGIESYKIEGTHMFPFERPEEAADLVIKVVEEILVASN